MDTEAEAREESAEPERVVQILGTPIIGSGEGSVRTVTDP